MRLFRIAVESLDVEAQLAEVLWQELADLELERDQACEAAVEEDEVDREVLFADLDRVFGTHEAKVATELGDEPAEVLKERTMQVPFGVSVCEVEELEAVGVLELVDRPWIRLVQSGGCFALESCSSLECVRPELPLELAGAPLPLDRGTDVKAAFFREFSVAKDAE